MARAGRRRRRRRSGLLRGRRDHLGRRAECERHQPPHPSNCTLERTRTRQISSMITNYEGSADPTPPTARHTATKAVLISVAAAVGGFLFGFDTAVVNGA